MEAMGAWNCLPMTGRAMPTTVPSMAARAEPRTVAAITHRPVAEPTTSPGSLAASSSTRSRPRPSADRRGHALEAGGQGRVPVADGAAVADGGPGEGQGGSVGIVGPAHVVPVEDELAEIGVEARRRRLEAARVVARRCGVGIGVEGRP